MNSAAGDIVIVLDADTQPFRRGLSEASRDLRQTQNDWSGLLNTMSGPGFARGMGQAGFALQDFTSVLAMGGKNALGRALMSTMNNVQMLGMAFGPMGAAITSVGGALASMLIPKLMESSEKTVELSDAFKEARTHAEEAGKSFEKAMRFEQSINNLSSPDQGNRMIDDLKLEEKALQRQRDDLAKLRDQARNEAATKPEMSPERQVWVDETKRLEKEIETADRKISTTHGNIFDLRAKTADAEAAKFAEDSMKAALKRDKQKADAELRQKQEDADALDAAQKVNEKRDEDRRRNAERIAEQAQSPFEVAQRKISELQQAMADGTIGQDLFDKASGKVIQDFGKSEQKDTKLGGAQAGSAAAFEMIRESIRDANRQKDSEQIRLLKKQADNSDSMSKNLEKIADAPPLKVEGIA